jgi:uncharacterized protein
MLDAENRERLRQRLDQAHQWPGVYRFKFILEPDARRLEKILALFPEEAEVLRKYSSGGKYLSLTINEVLMDADQVIDRYEKVSEVEGVIAL